MSLRTLVRQFGSFGLIGTAALAVDTGLLYFALRVLGLGFYSGRLMSWLGAATFTWYFNRRYTFRSDPGVPPVTQWLRFLGANSLGGLLNYGVYAALIASSALVREWPVLAVAAGSLSGLVVNFALSKRYVFSG